MECWNFLPRTRLLPVKLHALKSGRTERHRTSESTVHVQSDGFKFGAPRWDLGGALLESGKLLKSGQMERHRTSKATVHVQSGWL